jgi:hypothetical protein
MTAIVSRASTEHSAVGSLTSNFRTCDHLAFLAFIILLALTATPGSAQVAGSATLVGTVTDTTGAIVPGAKVTVTNIGTSFRSETTTSQDGNYFIPYLIPGTYQLTLEAPGFKRYLRDGLVLRTAETPRVDITVEVGATTESITVSGAAPLLATETAVAGQVLQGDTVVRIPVGQTAASRMLFYYPGVISSNGYHILGQRTRGIGFTLDGVTAKIPGRATFGDNDEVLQVSPEGIQEAKVTSSGMPAEYGHVTGGGLNIVMKSGTNDPHGSLGFQHVWKRLGHRDYLQPARDDQPLHYSWFNGSFQGPVYLGKLYDGRNRTFFLTTLRGFFQGGGQPLQRVAVPTEEMYAGNFSFGGIGLPIYNPFTTRQDATGRWVRDPFPGNQIPNNLFDPAVRNFLAQKPFAQPNNPGIPSRTGPAENLQTFQPRYIHRWSWDEKIDHQFSSSHKMFWRYSHMWQPIWTNAFTGQLAWKLIDSNAHNNPASNISGVLSDTYVISPTRFNEFRIGYNRRAQSFARPTTDQDWAKQLGIPNVSPRTFPNFNIGYGLSGLSDSRLVGEDLTFQDNFTQILRTHTIKAGYELVRTRVSSSLPELPSGTYNFAGTDLPFTPNTGNTFASFLLGAVGSAVYTQNFATWLPRWWQHALYVQDDWKVRPGLTMNLGLRWTYESPFQTKYGQQSQFNPTMTDPLTGGLGAIVHNKGPLAKSDWNNLRPRVGLAWNFHPKLVFRSSFGVIFPDLLVNNYDENFQEYSGTVNIQAPPGDPRHVFRLSEGPPPFRYVVQPDGSTPFVGTNYSARGAHWYDPNMRLPYIMTWSGGIQYQFANNWLLETMYEGSSGVGLLNNWDINAIPLDISRDPVVLNQIFQSVQNFRPYPHFGTIQHFSNYGHNSHHAGTLRVEKRFSSGLTFLGTYTLGKTLTDSDSDGTSSGVTYYNRALEKGRAGYDVRHHYMSFITYDLPFGRGRPYLNRGGILNAIVGDWNLVWTWTLETGLPTSVTFAGSPNRYLPSASRPNSRVTMEQAVVKDWDIGPHRFPISAQNPYLLFEAFEYPAAFTAGTLGKNTFERPGINWIQIGISKSWLIAERVRFTLRADGNNFPFKSPMFAAPVSSYNANSPLTFGRFNSLRGTYAGLGNSRPHTVLGGRIDF